MPSNDTTLKQYYAARAREYESIYAKPERQADLKRIADLLKPMFKGRRVLEIACGTGYWTQHIAAVAQSITGVDANQETLDVAAEKTWLANRVEFKIADAYALPDELGMFDATFAGFWWSHILARDRARFFASLNRRLLPGARVAFLDNLYVEGNSTPVSHRDAEGNTYQRRLLKNGTEHVVPKNFPTEQGLFADVAGFASNAHYAALEYFWLFSYETSAA